MLARIHCLSQVKSIILLQASVNEPGRRQLLEVCDYLHSLHRQQGKKWTAQNPASTPGLMPSSKGAICSEAKTPSQLTQHALLIGHCKKSSLIKEANGIRDYLSSL